VKRFLAGRLERTIAFSLQERMVDAISSAVHEALKAIDFGEEKKVLGILILARCEPDGYYTIHTNRTQQPYIGETSDGSRIVPNFARILEGFWASKFEEGKEAGSCDGACSFTGAEGEVVSAYCKAWPWAFPTWTCPLPLGGDERMLVESVALSPQTYRALTLGACVFNRLTRRLSSLVIPEIFAPADTRAGKEQAQRRKLSDLPAIYGSGCLLPLRDEVPTDQDQGRDFVRGVRGMLAPSTKDPTQADRYMTAVTGFESILPPGTTDDYRLTLIYFSGEVSRGDVHLRAYIQDVIPSTLCVLRDLAREEAKEAMQLLRTLMPKMSEKQMGYLAHCYESVPYLLARAYGGAYLWQQLEAVLHHKRLDHHRVIANAARRMNSLTPKWPDSRFDLFEEVGFYLSFLHVLDRANREVAGLHEDPPMRPWKDLLRSIDHSPVAELELTDPADIGFACGALVKRFSRAYYQAMKKTKGNADFLRDRVLTFGSELRPSAVHDKGLRLILELPDRLSSHKLRRSRDLEERTGAAIAAFQQARDQIDRNKDAFMTAFWSGYALEGHERPVKPKACPHCGKPLAAQASAPV
jgi:hypothetical protein